MSDTDDDKGYTAEYREINPDLVPMTRDEVTAKCGEIRELMDSLGCNFLVVVEGGAGSMCTLGNNLAPTFGLHTMQTLCAGVFSGRADGDELNVLEAVAKSIAPKLGAPPKEEKRIIVPGNRSLN